MAFRLEFEKLPSALCTWFRCLPAELGENPVADWFFYREIKFYEAGPSLRG